MEKPLLIVGLDPGTTLGYAILDIEGSIIETRSMRTHDLSAVIKRIIDKGYIIMVCSDKRKTPENVERFASLTGGKLFWPDHDLTLAEKRELARERQGLDSHQRDALASALYAYNSNKKIIRKAISLFNRKNAWKDAHRVMQKVLKDEMNFTEALLAASKERSSRSGHIAGKESSKGGQRILNPKQHKTEGRYAKEALMLRKEIEALKRRNRFLEKRIRQIKDRKDMQERINRKLYSRISKETKDKRIREAIANKDKKIALLRKDEKHLKKRLSEEQRKTASYRKLLACAEGNILAAKARNITAGALKGKGSIIYIEDPAEYSRNAAKALKGKTVIAQKIPKEIRRIKEAVFVEGKIKAIAETDDFMVIERKLFEKRKRKEVFEKIVSDYRRSRKKQGKAG